MPKKYVSRASRSSWWSTWRRCTHHATWTVFYVHNFGSRRLSSPTLSCYSEKSGLTPPTNLNQNALPKRITFRMQMNNHRLLHPETLRKSSEYSVRSSRYCRELQPLVTETKIVYWTILNSTAFSNQVFIQRNPYQCYCWFHLGIFSGLIKIFQKDFSNSNFILLNIQHFVQTIKIIW